ncbi:golgi uridine diphosphate-N- acetylglucosamine transporter [Ophidiomyces ophidiicola]|nr:golgi uridine diphosphate-N- acetylglucosamine transporter [Ophidiomyces ophidiicola]
MSDATTSPDSARQRKTQGAAASTSDPPSHTRKSVTHADGPMHAATRDGIEKRKNEGAGGIATAVAHATLPAWVNIALMLGLIFGGCCANVFTLEALVTDMPNAGALVTFTQFAITSLFTLPNVISFSSGKGPLFFKKRAVPIVKWAIFTAFFMTVNLMNNSAFLFKISVPLHIIIRSGGPVTSMIIGYLYNSKRYTRVQVAAVCLLSVGVVTAALADASAKGKSTKADLNATETASIRTLIGFTVLGLAMVLAAFQGVYADRLFQTYGRESWREGLFYSHALSLLFLLPTSGQFIPQIRNLLSSPSILGSSANPIANSSLPTPLVILLTNPFFHSILSHIPLKLLYLLLNALTQFLCIRGVYLLSAKSSSLTVTVVLNIRKLVSLVLSVYLFGNHLSSGVMTGAGVVFVAGGIYAWEGARLRKTQEIGTAKKKS